MVKNLSIIELMIAWWGIISLFLGLILIWLLLIEYVLFGILENRVVICF